MNELEFQPYQHNHNLGSSIDSGLNRAARNVDMIQEYVRDNSLRTALDPLRVAVLRAGVLLKGNENE